MHNVDAEMPSGELDAGELESRDVLQRGRGVVRGHGRDALDLEHRVQNAWTTLRRSKILSRRSEITDRRLEKVARDLD